MILYSMESEMNVNMKFLKLLILDRFSNDVEKFNTWSREQYQEVIIRVGGSMLPSKRPFYMENILDVAPKSGNINVLTLIICVKKH